MREHYHIDLATGQAYTDLDAGFCPSRHGMGGQRRITGPPPEVEVKESDLIMASGQYDPMSVEWECRRCGLRLTSTSSSRRPDHTHGRMA